VKETITTHIMDQKLRSWAERMFWDCYVSLRGKDGDGGGETYGVAVGEDGEVVSFYVHEAQDDVFPPVD
jgi:hypothetical protein